MPAYTFLSLLPPLTTSAFRLSQTHTVLCTILEGMEDLKLRKGSAGGLRDR